MKVVGKYRVVYDCDLSGKQKEGDGISYPISGKAGKRVKLLNHGLCTREKEFEVNKILNGEIQWNGPQILDLVYSHGKFSGFVYEDETMMVDTEVSIPDSTANTRQVGVTVVRSESRSKAAAKEIKSVYTVGAGACLALLTYFFFFQMYLEIVESTGGRELAMYCRTFNFSGITGIVGGIAGIFLVARFLRKAANNIYLLAVPIGYLVGMAAVFLTVTGIIVLVQLAYSLLIGIIPTLLGIGIVLYLLKFIFRR